ncbi:peptidylprolyl isomerase [Candidatus Collierbacteria bacterium]|nr:peptidylprolyl isomerase [Candidatus Collierbacteria bacterium]
MSKNLTLLVVLGLFLSACQGDLSSPSSPILSLPTATATVNPTVTSPTTPTPDVNQLLNLKPNEKMYATIKTSLGDIKIQLFADKAPKTVANFVGLAEGTKTGKPLYVGTIFHRVIKDFMIQGGDPLGTGMGGPGYKFEDEIDSSLTFDTPGILAMANSGPNTNGSQFFITTAPTTWLNGKHTIFGKVVSGMDIVTKIENTPVGENDKPVTPVTIESISIERK